VTQDEAALVAALQAGDKAAFAELVDTYSAKLYNVALRLLRDPAEAEDALQETFLSAFRAIGDFEGRSSLGTWLYRIATNASLMRLRKRRETLSLDAPLRLDDGDLVPRQLKDWSQMPEKALMSAEARQVMDEAIAELPDTLRAAFVLRDIEGLSGKETAEVLGISVAAMKSRLHRARLFLRERLSDYFALVQK
jgi:RNA polymerase sigma-70 factor (ECF subfamily)